MYDQNIIEPKNLPIWTAAGFIVALLALTIAITGIYRNSAAIVLSQAQVLLLNQKIEVLNKRLEKTPGNSTANASKP
jgi:Tfp pilus assembly protein PilN